jgi:hypothetical protein
MKRKNVTLAISALLMFLSTCTIKAQDVETTETDVKLTDTTVSNKRTFGKWLTETPWTVTFGGSIINDEGGKKLIYPSLFDYTNYPAFIAFDKNLSVNGLSAQFMFQSTSLKSHSYLSIDVNFKYDVNELIGDTKFFDPYVVSGLGYTLRDASPSKPNYDNLSTVNFNFGVGANFWLNKILAINTQGLAKFSGNSYLQANIGLVFKLSQPAPECEVTAKTPEAEDALQHLRGIINK